jgi:flagellar basal body-associated protein FliL
MVESPAVASGTASSSTAKGTAPVGGGTGPDSGGLSGGDLESVFLEEDPEFTGSMKAIHEDAELQNHALAGADAAGLDVDAALATASALPWTKRLRRLRLATSQAFGGGHATMAFRAKAWANWFLKTGLKAGLANGAWLAKAGLAAIAAKIARVWALPAQAKLILASLGLLFAMALALIGALLSGRHLPGFELPLLTSLAEVADARFALEPGAKMEEFDSPMRAAEHIVLLDKTVANLRREPDSGPTPMGLFEFYLEASSQEAAIEIENRKAEITDVIHRAVASMSFEELATKNGKEKLRLIMRRDINAVMTKGRVRRINYKTFILKA